MKIFRFLTALLFILPVSASTSGPWDKSPEQWNQGDAFRILRNSPWIPAKVKFEAKYTQRHTDPQTGIVSGSSINAENTNLVRGIELTRNTDLPDVPILWWSSKIVRLAELKLRLFHDGKNSSTEKLQVEELPDFVLKLEGSEYYRILKDAKEDLHDTVFLEMPDGFTLDLSDIKFNSGSDSEEMSVEFHFPREVEGRPSIDPETASVSFHCRATAKTSRPGEQNQISFRAEFHPIEMKAHGKSDF